MEWIAGTSVAFVTRVPVTEKQDCVHSDVDQAEQANTAMKVSATSRKQRNI